MKNRPTTVILALTFAALAIIIGTGCGRHDTAAISIAGSTTMEPLTSTLVRVYGEATRKHVVISANGSHTGISALIDGRCDIAESSTKISPEELESAHGKGITIKEFIIAKGMIVPIVHRSNPVRDISLERLRLIYTGNIRDWSGLGGQGVIDAVGRDGFSGTYDVWKRIVLKGVEPAREVKGMPSTTMVLAHVARHENAIGYVEYAYLNPDVRALRIDGTDAASLFDGKNMRYPLVRELYYYVTEKGFKGDVKKFIIFSLSKEGQEAAKRAGFIPVGPTR